MQAINWSLIKQTTATCQSNYESKETAVGKLCNWRAQNIQNKNKKGHMQVRGNEEEAERLRLNNTGVRPSFIIDNSVNKKDLLSHV